MRYLRHVVLLTVTLVGAGYAYSHFAIRGNGAMADAPAIPANARIETAVFAGGCFWCMEPPFEKLTGVISAESGYTGGHVDNPTYQQVSHTETGHVEAIRVTYDANQVGYNDLLEVFWRSFDPTDDGGQFHDRGTSYLSAIFVANDHERQLAEESKASLMASGRFKKPIVTPIRDAAVFYPAEEYHQDYYKKNPLHYKTYRYGSGRDAFIENAWGKDRHYMPKLRTFVKPSEQELRKKLTPLQFSVTQEDGTERAFSSELWDNKSLGIYVDVVSGEPLFSSLDKYKSGTGWPSFTQPIHKDNVVERTDYKLLLPRTEVRSKLADSHLGHVFDDGPQPTGRRYCINAASLRFVPAKDLRKEGYSQYASRFKVDSRS